MARSPGDGGAKTGSDALARLVRDRRERLGMTRHDLAEATGVPYPTIAQIETAYRGASPGRLKVIAGALGLDPADLYAVLAADAAGPSAKPARGGRPAAAARGEGRWLANPSYASPAAPLASEPAPTPPGSPPSAADVVDRVVALLDQLPPQERLDALGRVQSRLLAGLVRDEVRRAVKPPPRR